MKILLRSALVACVMAAWLVPASPAAAQPPKGLTGTQFYMAYLAAFAKAKSFDEVTPWLAKERRDQVSAAPGDEKKMMWEMVKELTADKKGVKVVKETPTANGADLDVVATSQMGGKSTGKITLVKEEGEWKVARESWKS